MTFSEYKQLIERDFGVCQVLRSNYDHKEKNCDGTGNRTAPKAISWIDYWRALTDKLDDTMTCSCCGKEIIVGQGREGTVSYRQACSLYCDGS